MVFAVVGPDVQLTGALEQCRLIPSALHTVKKYGTCPSTKVLDSQGTWIVENDLVKRARLKRKC